MLTEVKINLKNLFKTGWFESDDFHKHPYNPQDLKYYYNNYFFLFS